MAEQSKLATRCDGVEWVYNNHARNEGVTKPVSTYIFGNLIDAHPIIIIIVLPPGVVCPSNRALPMPGTADVDAVSRCQVLVRAGSVHHWADL